MGRFLQQASQQLWKVQPVQPTRQHCVGIAGLGFLGQTCAQALLALGYRVRGWRRSAPTAADALPADVALFHGDSQQADFLAGCDTLDVRDVRCSLGDLQDHRVGVLNKNVIVRRGHSDIPDLHVALVTSSYADEVGPVARAIDGDG
jgi:glyoxylate/hydroxypyruvate reductase A